VARQFEYGCDSLESFFLGLSFDLDFNWYKVGHVIERFKNYEWPLNMGNFFLDCFGCSIRSASSF